MNICIITGSTLGGAEYVGDHLADLLEQQGHQVQVENQANLEDVRDQSVWLIVTSTHGAGELPDNLKPLFAQINAEKPDLSVLRYGVVGLGNSDYDTFCFAVDEVERALNAQGAVKICESLRIDVKTTFDHEQAAEEWLPSFIDMM